MLYLVTGGVMKYIRQRGNGNWQFQIYNSEHNVSITKKNLDEVIEHRNKYLGYDPDIEDVPISDSEEFSVLDLGDYEGEFVFGTCGDAHYGSVYADMDAVSKLYDVYDDVFLNLEKQDELPIFMTGNYLEGVSRFNKHEIDVWGVSNQVEGFIREYPHIDGIKTYFVDGDDHEGWFTKELGVNTGEYLESIAETKFDRYDLVYLGYMEQDVVIRLNGEEILIRVCHPGGGSRATAISYAGQKIVDTSYDNPDILLLGHFHKTHFLPDYKGVHIIQTGCTELQTSYMRKKTIIPQIGGWVVKVRGKKDIETRYVGFENRKWVAR